MLPLTRTEEMILLAVYHLRPDAYGITIRRYLEEMMAQKFSVGAIYVPLERLTEKGYLTTYQGEPTPERGGRSKRFYQVTAAGRAALKETQRLHKAMWANVVDLDEPEAGVA